MLEIAMYSRPFAGEENNGDGYLAVLLNNGEVARRAVSSQKAPASTDVIEAREADSALVAVVDGVGHGDEAAIETKKILRCIDSSLSLDLTALVEECHKSVAHTRGAALSIARFDLKKRVISYVGVGNVRLQVLTSEINDDRIGPGRLSAAPGNAMVTMHELATNNGIVGYNLPRRLLTVDYKYAPGDVIVMCTDGIDGAKCNMGQIARFFGLSAADTADGIRREFALEHDDATVVILKARGD